MTNRGTTRPPDFTPTQQAWLREMLTPGCCHTSGEHDPRHFRQDKHVCLYQRSDTYNTLRTALGLGDVQPQEARSTPGCVWCEEYDERPERLKTEGTPAQNAAPTAQPAAQPAATRLGTRGHRQRPTEPSP